MSKQSNEMVNSTLRMSFTYKDETRAQRCRSTLALTVDAHGTRTPPKRTRVFGRTGAKEINGRRYCHS
jgi:hypothetical protein